MVFFKKKNTFISSALTKAYAALLEEQEKK